MRYHFSCDEIRETLFTHMFHVRGPIVRIMQSIDSKFYQWLTMRPRDRSMVEVMLMDIYFQQKDTIIVNFYCNFTKELQRIVTTDQPMGKPSYRDARTRLEIDKTMTQKSSSSPY